MTNTNDYREYISRIGSGETLCVFSGESNVLRVVASEEHMPTGLFYVWGDLNDEGQTVLLKAEYDGESLHIIKGWSIDKTLYDIAKSLEIDNLEAAMSWWNSCYYRDSQGKVRYDSYYDEHLFAANKTEKKMSDLQAAITLWIEDLLEQENGVIYVLGSLAVCNPIIFQLQQKGFDVKNLQTDKSNDYSDMNERILQLRKQLAAPYCDNDTVKVSFITSEGGGSPAKCHHSYLITIPIDLINIEDKAIGDFTYKDILSNGKFCRDYSCCGHDYCYVEMDLFADLHGNTVLKTTNSKAESKYTIINRFYYTYLQKDGQSNS